MDLSPSQVNQLPYNDKEINHLSDKRQAYHVFLSRFITDFKLQSTEYQRNYLQNNNVNTYQHHSDASSVDSTDTNYYNNEIDTPIAHMTIYKLAIKQWNDMDKPTKNAWKKRTKELNAYPKIGKFYSLPPQSMNVQFQLDALTKDWKYVTNIFRGALIKKNKAGIADRKYIIGKETIKVGQQRYRELHLNSLIESFIFGINYSNLVSSELILKTKNQLIIHLHSFERINQLFTLAGLSAVKHHYMKKDYLAAGKIFLKNCIDNKQTFGFVMAENNHHLEVRLITNTTLKMQRPLYKENLGGYDFTGCYDSDSIYSIVEYHPVRMKVSTKTGRMVFLMHRAVFYSHDGSIDPFIF